MMRRLMYVLLLLTSCAETKPEQKPPAKDEFTGFGALRVSEPKAKKAEPAADKGDDEKGDAKADAKGDIKGEAGEEKTALTKEQVLGALGTAQKRVDACLKKFKEPGIYVVEITIAQDGTCGVQPMRAPTRKEQPDLWNEVEAGIDGGKSPKSPTNRCLAAAITPVQFPAFKAEKPLVVTYPIVLR